MRRYILSLACMNAKPKDITCQLLRSRNSNSRATHCTRAPNYVTVFPNAPLLTESSVNYPAHPHLAFSVQDVHLLDSEKRGAGRQGMVGASQVRPEVFTDNLPADSRWEFSVDGAKSVHLPFVIMPKPVCKFANRSPFHRRPDGLLCNSKSQFPIAF